MMMEIFSPDDNRHCLSFDRTSPSFVVIFRLIVSLCRLYLKVSICSIYMAANSPTSLARVSASSTNQTFFSSNISFFGDFTFQQSGVPSQDIYQEGLCYCLPVGWCFGDCKLEAFWTMTVSSKRSGGLRPHPPVTHHQSSSNRFMKISSIDSVTAGFECRLRHISYIGFNFQTSILCFVAFILHCKLSYALKIKVHTPNE